MDLASVLKNLSMVWPAKHALQAILYQAHWKIVYHLCSFHFLTLGFTWLRCLYPSRLMSKPSLNHVSVIKCSQIRESSRNSSFTGVSSLFNRSDLDYRTHHFNLCNKEIPAGTQHSQHWWPSRTPELCCACSTWSSIATTPDCKNSFWGPW